MSQRTRPEDAKVFWFFFFKKEQIFPYNTLIKLDFFPDRLASPRSAARNDVLLDNATTLGDLRWPPGNQLEALSGDRVGQHSIRLNDQFRICFIWKFGNAELVEIVDDR